MMVMSIFGTQPEMIKMWATPKEFEELNFDHVKVHTGQNFTPQLAHGDRTQGDAGERGDHCVRHGRERYR
jgi:UDP-N-acetylglucosamine 2-epimerase